MGKLGRVEIALEKPYYVVGQQVNGTLYVEAHADLPLDKIYVKCKGKEKVKWEEHWEETIYEGEGEDRHVVGHEHHEKEYDEKDEFFKLKVMLGGEGVLPAGKHAFPFSFNLPTHSNKGKPLAGSFKYKDGSAGFSGGRRVKDLKAKVEYSLKACVDIDDCKDLEKKVDMTVFQQPTHMIDRPMGQKVENVMMCCCINKGEVSIRASCNKTYYTPGETGVAIMYLRNDSSVEIVPKVELNRFLYFKVPPPPPLRVCVSRLLALSLALSLCVCACACVRARTLPPSLSTRGANTCFDGVLHCLPCAGRWAPHIRP